MYGKYPHPSTLVPGGVSTTVSTTTFNEYYANLGLIFDYAKRLAGIWDDICDFFLEANPAYSDVGLRPSNLIQTGIWDDLEVYDATYANIDAWGQARYSAPGIIKEGELLTTKLTEINMGIEEFVEHSYYEDWTNGNGNGHMPFPTDALGNPLSPYHSWNKETIPRPEGKNFKEKYSWDTAPRWDRTAMETGVYGACGPPPWPSSCPTTPTSRPPATGCACCCPRTTSPRPSCSAGAGEAQRLRAQPGPGLRGGLHRGHRDDLSDAGLRVLAQGRDQGLDAVQGSPRRAGVRRLLGGRAGIPDPPHAHGQGAAAQLPDQHAVHLERLAPGPRSAIPGPTSRPSLERRSWRASATTTSRASTSCGRSAASIRACRAPPTWTPAGGS